MAFIINVTPVEIERISERLEKQRREEARRLAISKETEKGIQENPLQRNKFQTD